MDTKWDQQITIASALAGYPKEAILFVLCGWELIEWYSPISGDGQTLCWLLHDHALIHYQSNALEQLKCYKITSTEDFGKIILVLLEEELVPPRTGLELSDFQDVFEFEEQFSTPKLHTPGKISQWSLRALLVFTAIAAVALSGVVRGGVQGGVFALYFGWLVAFGICCIVFGVSNRQRGWGYLLMIGVVAFAIGLFMFFTFSVQ